MTKQKAIYVALVFGDLNRSAADNSPEIDPQGKRDFFITAPSVLDMIGAKGKKEFLMQAELAYEALTADVESGGLTF